MKIAFVVPSLVNKGPIVVVHNLVKYLEDKVELLDVYYFDTNPSKLKFSCNIHQINKHECIDFDKYDIVHSHTLRADLYVYKWRNKINRAKTISTLHQDTLFSFSLRYNKFASLILTHYWCFIHRRFDGVISISNQLKNKYNKLLSNKIMTIHNGCSIDFSEINLETKNLILNYKRMGYKILGSYAYITKGKGLSQVINVLNFLPDYVFVIIGEGPYLAELKRSVERLKILDRVLFIPYIHAPYSYLQFMDVYMMPSYSEGFGLAMVEAALTKKSIVCSNIPSFHEIFASDEVCFFELDNPDSLIESIKLAYIQRDRLGELAYHKASVFFTSEKMAENHLLYYQNILNKHVDF